jgi:hypothetical protein
MTMTTTDRISRVWHTVADFQTKSTPWPDPESSIGAFCRELGKNKCWELIGPGLERYQSLAKDVKEYLEQYCQKETATVLWSAYMVGRSAKLACPTVFFCSRQADPRKRVRKIVDESSILEKYPGFKTSDSNRPPDMDQLIKLAGDGSVKPIGSTCTCGSPTGLSINTRSAQSELTTQHTYNMATVGAILHFGDTLCFTTAAHAFETEDIGFESQDDSDFEFDLDDDLDNEIESEGRSECEILPAQPISDFQSCVGTPQLQLEPRSQPASSSGLEAFFGKEDVVFSSLDIVNPFLDYALVPINPKDLRLVGAQIYQEGTCDYHHALPENIARSNRGGTVVAFTGSRHAISGRLSRTPSFMTSMLHHVTQELWTVTFDGHLARGDCGSLVVDLAEKEYVGHIVAGSLTSGSALVVPASDVFDDIRNRSGKSLSLANDIGKADTYDSIDKAGALSGDKTPSEVMMTVSDGQGTLWAPAKAGQTDTMNRLLTAGASVDAGVDKYASQTALQAATERGNGDMVDKLLATGADVNAGDSPMMPDESQTLLDTQISFLVSQRTSLQTHATLLTHDRTQTPHLYTSPWKRMHTSSSRYPSFCYKTPTMTTTMNL